MATYHTLEGQQLFRRTMEEMMVGIPSRAVPYACRTTLEQDATERSLLYRLGTFHCGVKDVGEELSFLMVLTKRPRIIRKLKRMRRILTQDRSERESLAELHKSGLTLVDVARWIVRAHFPS